MVLDPERTARIARTPTGTAGKSTLVEMLEAQQRIEGVSGATLMAGCGLSSSLWSRVRRGHERFGVDACAKIVARYPHLRASAARDLAEQYGRPSLTLLEDASRVARGRDCPDGLTACR